MDLSRSKKPVRTSGKRGQGTYARQACDICRSRRIKCSGTKPICAACSEGCLDCTWGSRAPKNQINKQYVEALQSRVQALESQVALLEEQLGRGSLSTTSVDTDSPDSHCLDTHPPKMESTKEVANGDAVQELCAPTERLVLDNDELLLYGPASVFRFAPRAEPTTRFSVTETSSDQTYNLMVDGANPAHYDPKFEWARYLPKGTGLDRLEHDRLVDLFMKFFTSWCQRIIPTLFLRDMFRCLSTPVGVIPPKTPHYSPMLHNALISMAATFSDIPEIQDIRTRERFASEAKKHLESEVQKPNISAIQALSLLASFYSSQGNQTLGFLYFGMSARTSEAMGLGIDCSPWVKSKLISYDDMLDRYWTFWTTFSQDVCWALYVGREATVNLPKTRSSIPVPFIDADFDKMSWHYPPSKIPPQPHCLSVTFAATCELLLIARRVNEIITCGDKINDEIVSKIDLQLTHWEQHLPPEVKMGPSDKSSATPHRLMVYLAYWWMFMLLHRPMYRAEQGMVGSRAINHAKICDNAAKNVMDLLEAWRSSYTLRYIPITLIQVTFCAGTVFVLSTARSLSGLRVAQVSLAKSIGQVEQCIQYLSESGQSWACASGISDTLRSLLQKHMSSCSTKGAKSIPPEMRPAFIVSPLSTNPAEMKHNPQASALNAQQLVTPIHPSHWHSGQSPPPPTPVVTTPPNASGYYPTSSFEMILDAPMFGMLGGEALPSQPFMFPTETRYSGFPIQDRFEQHAFSEEDWAAIQAFLGSSM